MNHTPIPSAQSIVWGIALTSVAAPVLFWLALLAGGNGFLTFLAVVAGMIGLGLLLYGAYAFFTSFDAMAARYLGANRPAAAAGPATAYPPAPTTSSSAPFPTSSAPFPTYSRPSSKPSTRRGGPTAASLLDSPPPPKPDSPPPPPREATRIVATPLPPSDDDDA